MRTALRLKMWSGRSGWGRAVLAAGLLAGGVLASDAAPAPVAAAAPGQDCVVPERPFDPATLAIPGVVGRTRVLALGRDAHGVPRPPPLTDKGKWQFAWDKESGIRPGSAEGTVPLTAHTYPRDGSYGLALGNRLLARLHLGDLMVAEGRHGERLCYRVAKTLVVRAEQKVPAYYAQTGPPRLAILVCSGTRRGPGDWSHRTIWFAEPVV